MSEEFVKPSVIAGKSRVDRASDIDRNMDIDLLSPGRAVITNPKPAHDPNLESSLVYDNVQQLEQSTLEWHICQACLLCIFRV